MLIRNFCAARSEVHNDRTDAVKYVVKGCQLHTHYEILKLQSLTNYWHYLL